MANIVVVGMQWGDEGKGKIVDLLCPAFPCVARYQGGHNAGHTVKFGDQHFALHLIPSGILHADTQCFLGNGMVISPQAFLTELAGLEEAGIDAQGRLHISDRAHVLILAHQALDSAREETAGDQKIGTTSRGIGPAYENKYSRFGLRMGDLIAGDFADRLAPQLDRIASDLRGIGASVSPTLLPDTIENCEAVRDRLAPYLCDVSLELNRAIDEGRSVLFEGAQGTLLDVDHGTFPFVTSSNSTSGGAAIGTGVPPTRIDGVLGILKAYTTRVGEGPFPTELLEGEVLEYLRKRGHEFGTTTGRPRRCGWLDLVIARYARRVNGISSIALTKLDVLDSLAEIEVCVGYRIDGQVIRDFPADTRVLNRVAPVYKTFKGWQSDTVGTLSVEELPPSARDYVAFIEQEVEAEVGIISTGPRREETILSPQPTLRAWLGEAVSVVTSQLA